MSSKEVMIDDEIYDEIDDEIDDEIYDEIDDEIYDVTVEKLGWKGTI